MTDTITLTREQIEAIRDDANAPSEDRNHNHSMLVNRKKLAALCNLALQAKNIEPRPIDKLDPDINEILGYERSVWYEMHAKDDGWRHANNDPSDTWGKTFSPTHFILLSELPTPERAQ